MQALFHFFRSDLFNKTRGSRTQIVNASVSRGLFGAKFENKNFRYSWKKVSRRSNDLFCDLLCILSDPLFNNLTHLLVIGFGFGIPKGTTL